VRRELERELTLAERELARKLTIWVLWRTEPEVEVIAAYQLRRLAESHACLEGGVESFAACTGLLIQEWNLVEAFACGHIDLDRAVGYVRMQAVGVEGTTEPLRTEPSAQEKQYAAGVPIWDVWYEDRFSHEGSLVDSFLTEEEARARVDELGGPVDMESGKFDGYEVSAHTLSERFGSIELPEERLRALVLRHRGEAELASRRVR
jgi:hypothetical protein